MYSIVCSYQPQLIVVNILRICLSGCVYLRSGFPLLFWTALAFLFAAKMFKINRAGRIGIIAFSIEILRYIYFLILWFLAKPNRIVSTLTVISAARHCTYLAVVQGCAAISLHCLYLFFGISSKWLYTFPPPASIWFFKYSFTKGSVLNLVFLVVNELWPLLYKKKAGIYIWFECGNNAKYISWVSWFTCLFHRYCARQNKIFVSK